MIDWGLIEGFDWDEGNSRKSADKHGVTQAEAEQVFFNDPLLWTMQATAFSSRGCMRWDGPMPGGTFTSPSPCAGAAP